MIDDGVYRKKRGQDGEMEPGRVNPAKDNQVEGRSRDTAEPAQELSHSKLNGLESRFPNHVA